MRIDFAMILVRRLEHENGMPMCGRRGGYLIRRGQRAVERMILGGGRIEVGVGARYRAFWARADARSCRCMALM